jgi:hypothetical protein
MVIHTLPMANDMSAREILETDGLKKIAARLCEEKGLQTMEDLARLSDMEIDGISWLKEVQNLKWKDLCEACRRGDAGSRASIAKEARAENMERIKIELEKVRERLWEKERARRHEMHALCSEFGRYVSGRVCYFNYRAAVENFGASVENFG